MELYEKIEKLCADAKSASASLAQATTKQKNDSLEAIAGLLQERQSELLSANRLDLENAKANGVPEHMLDRLALNEKRIGSICESLREIVSLTDPIGCGEVWTRPSGITVKRVRAPLGVIGIIYESRPNVTVDAAALCLKTGNAVVLRGGKEAIRSSIALVESMRRALVARGFSPDLIGLITMTDRAGATALMNMRGLVDVLIPRGGKGLIRSVVENARIPVIETGAGNCHLYVDAAADLAKAVKVAVNAKCSRPSVCNAIETLLVHRAVANEFLPMMAEAMAAYNVEFRGDEATCAILPTAIPATEEDWDTEYNDFILSVRVVDTIDEAIAHIARYSTGHSEAIMTESMAAANRFRDEVDAAAVYVNVSTRFTDGGEFGFGAEIGISTQKLHARGPMGLYALTTDKYLIDGDGQVR